MRRVFFLAYSFVVMNWAAVAALYYFASGRKNLWSSDNCVHQRKKSRRLL
jgi:hypothetical protein